MDSRHPVSDARHIFSERRKEIMKKHKDFLPWEILYFVDSKGICPFQTWFLRDLNRVQQFALRHAISKSLIEIVAIGMKSPAIKSLGAGLYEYRLSMSQKELRSLVANFPDIPSVDISKILIRVFYTLGPNRRIVIFSGYDKLANPHKRNQQVEIQKARKLRQAWQRMR